MFPSSGGSLGMVGQKWSWSEETKACGNRHCGYIIANPVAGGDAMWQPLNETVEDRYLIWFTVFAELSETIDCRCRLKIIIKDCSVSSFLLLIY